MCPVVDDHWQQIHKHGPCFIPCPFLHFFPCVILLLSSLLSSTPLGSEQTWNGSGFFAYNWNLEPSCLQLSFFAYSCFSELLCLQFGLFVLMVGKFQAFFFAYSWNCGLVSLLTVGHAAYSWKCTFRLLCLLFEIRVSASSLQLKLRFGFFSLTAGNCVSIVFKICLQSEIAFRFLLTARNCIEVFRVYGGQISVFPYSWILRFGFWAQKGHGISISLLTVRNVAYFWNFEFRFVCLQSEFWFRFFVYNWRCRLQLEVHISVFCLQFEICILVFHLQFYRGEGPMRKERAGQERSRKGGEGHRKQMVGNKKDKTEEGKEQNTSRKMRFSLVVCGGMGHNKGEGAGKTAARDVGRVNRKQSRVGRTQKNRGEAAQHGGICGQGGRPGGKSG